MSRPNGKTLPSREQLQIQELGRRVSSAEQRLEAAEYGQARQHRNLVKEMTALSANLRACSLEVRGFRGELGRADLPTLVRKVDAILEAMKELTAAGRIGGQGGSL